jgi:hypothetical protein
MCRVGFKCGHFAATARCASDWRGQNHAAHDFVGAPQASKRIEGRITEANTPVCPSVHGAGVKFCEAS